MLQIQSSFGYFYQRQRKRERESCANDERDGIFLRDVTGARRENLDYQ